MPPTPEHPDEGWVYILTNAAMPNYVKIGLSRQDDLVARLRALDNTSMPLPFECYFKARVPDCRRLERTLHFVFGERRARRSREFFTIDADLAKAIIELVALQEAEPTDAQQHISADERAEIDKQVAARTPRRTLAGVGLSPGDVLVFSKDPAVTAVVHDHSLVEFEGVVMSPSAAALKAIHNMGYEWNTVSGFDYWTFQGVKLWALGRTPAAQVDGSDDEPDPTPLLHDR